MVELSRIPSDHVGEAYWLSPVYLYNAIKNGTIAIVDGKATVPITTCAGKPGSCQSLAIEVRD